MTESELLSFYKKLELKILILDFLLFLFSGFTLFSFIYLFSAPGFIDLELDPYYLFASLVLPIILIPVFFIFRYKYHKLDFVETPSIKKTQAERDEEDFSFRDFLRYFGVVVLSFPLSLLLIFDFFYRLYTVPKICFSKES